MINVGTGVKSNVSFSRVSILSYKRVTRAEMRVLKKKKKRKIGKKTVPSVLFFGRR